MERRAAVKITLKGAQGSGKSTILEVLRSAGWKVSEEKLIGDTNDITATAIMPKASPYIYRAPFEREVRRHAKPRGR